VWLRSRGPLEVWTADRRAVRRPGRLGSQQIGGVARLRRPAGGGGEVLQTRSGGDEGIAVRGRRRRASHGTDYPLEHRPRRSPYRRHQHLPDLRVVVAVAHESGGQPPVFGAPGKVWFAVALVALGARGVDARSREDAAQAAAGRVPEADAV